MVLTYTIQAKLEARKRAVMDAHKKMESTALRLRMCIVAVVREEHAHSLTEADRKKLEKLKSAPPVDVERTKLRQELLSIAGTRVNLVRDYVVCGLPNTLSCVRH